MPFKIVRNDITKMKVDAIVNTANAAPIYANGTDRAIYEAAGADKLLAARARIGVLREGEAAITPGFNLPAKYIIHTVSPLYVDGTQGEEEKLRACYEKSLQLALKYRCKSIAFPLIATGSFGYPKSEGMEIALSVIQAFLMKKDIMIYLVVFDKESVRLSGQIFDEIEEFIDENYVADRQKKEYANICCSRLMDSDMKAEDFSIREFEAKPVESLVLMPTLSQYPEPKRKLFTQASKRSLEDLMSNVGETFQQRLFRLIDERGRDEVEVYKRACKDKKFFHKIRKNVNYQPTKHTVFAFGLSLELSLDELRDLLASAGFALSPSSRFDLIMQYVFEQEIYDIYKVDCILYDFGEEHYFGCD